MRVFLATTLCTGLFANMAMAETEFTFSVGAMQRSYSDDTLLVFSIPSAVRLTSEDTEAIGQSVDVQFLNDRFWGRAFFYGDNFTTSTAVTDFSGLYVAVAGTGIGLGLNTSLDFERETSLTRVDLLYEVAQFGDVSVFAGPSFVQFSDSMQFDLSSGTTLDLGFDGRTILRGAAVGARYDIGPPEGSNGFNFAAHGTIGVYQASHSATYTAAGSGAVGIPLSFNASSTGSTTAADLGLTVGYTVSEMSEISLTYNVGYYGDFVDTAAIISSTNAFGGTTSLTTDAVIFQGLSLRYTMRF